MSTWVIALECFKNNFMHYPVEVSLLNISEGFCYTYHINYPEQSLENRHKRQFEEHGLGWQDGIYTYDWVKETLREHLDYRYMDDLYVFNSEHIYLVEHWFPRHWRRIYECPPLPLGDNTQHEETCAVHKRLGEKFSCARRKCFQAAVVIGNHKND
jgi:hypothetical protein